MLPTGYNRKPGGDIYRPRGFQNPILEVSIFLLSIVRVYAYLVPFYAA